MIQKIRDVNIPQVPPIKSQGIKTKLVLWISQIIPPDWNGVWIEPFMGTGVVGFNISPSRAVMCDVNPHLIAFYKSIQDKKITGATVSEYLKYEGAKLREIGEDHYYFVRDRFNREKAPLDFLFCNRAGFNGMIRFNKKGFLNIPFCRKPDRFAQAYVTKIVNQVNRISEVITRGDYTFKVQDFKDTIAIAGSNDLIYCDPPYIDRHVDYYGGWSDELESSLFSCLNSTQARFILSTWHHNDYRKNDYIEKIWNKFSILTREHFYHVGGSEDNRNPMIEAVVCNYEAKVLEMKRPVQLSLFQDG
jgi:DNA adenine methylase